ncbi:MAG: 23S rRNA (pseudouridine(1915)-N(3))-methyltransferase RlmH [Bacteroidetes bacterium RBG_19FT_COMBO_42_7]|nr:MAG: 23S rRNA (pseudouridine(1915)-N(3))-methyltransferase RlmH [Bacteroidetes bacterium RBG_13_42_15]OFY73225.1 MAG: 23S rRNA (pseudouridine(1915)-N(3))-methyltransferase RlmH [Bacteroidetes bacterium RBG_19FT_COMBO_42_7]
MKIALLQVGKTSERYLAEGIAVFEERIRKYSAFEIITIPDLRNTRSMPVKGQKAREGEKIIQYFKKDDYIVILEDKGKEFSTMEFSSWLEKILILQKKRILFVTGGAWGFSDEIYGKADMRLSLSRLTFSHQMVRLLFIEQLYRAFTVIKGEPYHHE